MDSKKGAAIGVGIAAVIAAAVAAGMMGSAPMDEAGDQIAPDDEGVPEAPAVGEAPVEGGDGLSGDVTIGLILPLTGDLAHKGHENWEGSKFGLQQFNKYLEERGEPWQLRMISEDSATNPVVALEKLTSLKAKGIDIVVGPETSSNIRNIKGYADSNNMLLFSCCSTAPALSIAGDSVYRLVPNDTFQGTAIAKKIQHDGAQVLVPMWRGDAWGDGLTEATVKSIKERGLAVAEGVRYNPESPELSASVSLLAAQVQELAGDYEMDEIAVSIFGFGETVNAAQTASQYDILGDVRWYGGASNVKEIGFIEDPIASEFANKVQFTASQFSISENEVTEQIDEYVLEALGREGYAYINTSHDVVWLLGLSILEAQSTDVDAVKAVLPEVASKYSGALDSVDLNEAGDLSGADYGIWSVIDNEWVIADVYDFETDSIVDPAADAAGLSGDVTIGLILPLTGDLAHKGHENWEGSKFGLQQFNKYLEERGEPWQLRMISEDSATNPVVALEKLTSLKAKGIDIVVGPETSSNIRNIKGYADSNNMLLFSCCSTAPALSIAGDSVYRLVPNDTFQGTAIAKKIQHDGAQVLVPMWRGDAWGDGLTEATVKSIKERGLAVAEGVRYNPESPELSASVSLLAAQVQELAGDYEMDEIAVSIFGFGETVNAAQTASQYDILGDVRWYGGASNVKEIGFIEDPIASEFANKVQFTASQFSISENEVTEQIDEYVLEALGREGYAYINTSHDVVWLLGLSILEAQSTDVDAVKAVLPEVASKYSGALDSVDLNEAGDLGAADYRIWSVIDNEWVIADVYDFETDSIVPPA